MAERQFTPFKDIWQVIARDMGITTKRMRESALEAEASRINELHAFNRSLAEAMTAPGTTPEDQAQLALIMRDAAFATDAINKNAIRFARQGRIEALPRLPGAAEVLRPMYEDQEEYRQAQEAAAVRRAQELQDEYRERQQELADMFQKREWELSDKLRQEAIQLDNERWNRLGEITDDLKAESKDFLTQKEAYARIIAADQGDSGFDDFSLIFNYMKMLDPNSVVRESEFANAEATNLALPDIVSKYRESWLQGKRLTPQQRYDLRNNVDRIMAESNKLQLERNQRYQSRGIAGDLPENLVREIGIPLSDIPSREEAPGTTLPGRISRQINQQINADSSLGDAVDTGLLVGGVAGAGAGAAAIYRTAKEMLTNAADVQAWEAETEIQYQNAQQALEQARRDRLDTNTINERKTKLWEAKQNRIAARQLAADHGLPKSWWEAGARTFTRGGGNMLKAATSAALKFGTGAALFEVLAQLPESVMNILNQQEVDEDALALRPGETEQQYKERVAAYLTRRAGEPIDAGMIRRPTND